MLLPLTSLEFLLIYTAEYNNIELKTAPEAIVSVKLNIYVTDYACWTKLFLQNNERKVLCMFIYSDKHVC